MKKVQLITDGSCLGNPGPGGWACILRYGKHKREMYGYAPHTTNNRMELTAVIEGLRALKESCQVEIITDSEYVKLDSQLEAEQLDDIHQEAGSEPRFVGRARSPGRRAPRPMGLDQGSRLTRGQ